MTAVGPVVRAYGTFVAAIFRSPTSACRVGVDHPDLVVLSQFSRLSLGLRVLAPAESLFLFERDCRANAAVSSGRGSGCDVVWCGGSLLVDQEVFLVCLVCLVGSPCVVQLECHGTSFGLACGGL